jgi:alpha-L-fucosidase
MYQENSSGYKYHLAHYGHPSQFGYKDIIPLWKAEKWDPEKLMALYKKVGAKYFVSMGTHHDNFFLWNSKIHRWNAVQMGPHKDVVGLWQKAAQRNGLKFGVSEHLGASYTWFQPAHRADTAGEYKGIPYDGNDPQDFDLYHTKADAADKDWLSINPAWHLEWFNSIRELIDNYHPDLLYSDSKLPFELAGRSMLAHFYNDNLSLHNGHLTAVYTCKEASNGMWVQDLERGVQDTISPFPWQTDTSIGDWYYRTGQKYKSATEIIQMLVDIVSKNGNLLINIVQTPEGDLEPDILTTLDEIANWMEANGEGIYGTRPWKIFGERPPNAPDVNAGNFNEDKIKYTSEDVRFTTKGKILYAFLLDQSSVDLRIKSLGKNSKWNTGKIKSVKMLGSSTKLQWEQKEDLLVIKKPAHLPKWKVLGLKLEFSN